MSSPTRVLRNALPNLSKGKNPKSSHIKIVYTNVCSLGRKQEKLELCAQSESYDIIENSETWWENSTLYVKQKLECMEVSYGDHGSSIEYLSIKIREIIIKDGLLLGICYWPPSQDDKADESLLQELKEVSGQQNLVLMGDLNYPGICWENNTAVHKSSIRFLECILAPDAGHAD